MTPADAAPAAPRWRWPVVVASLVVATALWTLHVDAAGRAAGLFHDEGVYLVTARALADGAGYRRTNLPGAPAEVRYPPALPVALSFVWRAAPHFPGNLPLLKAVGLLAVLGLVLVLPGYLRAAGLTPEVAAATAAFTAAAPLTVRYATAVASELPFALLAVLALWSVERAARPGARPASAVLAGLFAGLAFLTRTVGAGVIGAGLLALALRPATRRQAVSFGLASLPCVVCWAVWVAVQADPAGGPSYAAAFAGDGAPGVGHLLRHVLELPAAVALVTVPGLADLLPLDASPAILVAVYATGLLVLVVALRQRFGLYLVLTFVVIVAVPWFQPRFLVPLAPLLLAALLSAFLPAGAGPRRRVGLLAMLPALALATAAGNQVRLAGVRASGLPALEQASFEGGTWTELDDALGWLRARTAPDAVLASFHDPVLHLYTGRPTVQAYPALWHPHPDQVTAALAAASVDYLVDLPCPAAGVWAGARAAWEAWVDAHRDALTAVYTGAGGRIRVWRLDAARVGGVE